MLRLVQPSQGLEVTRARVRRHVLYQAGEAQDRVDRVLQKWVDAHLIRLTEGETPEDDQLEVAHEALVRNWPRLVGWLDKERVRLRQRQRLTTQAEHGLKTAVIRGCCCGVPPCLKPSNMKNSTP
ncbi:MAG: hypothetical protein M5U34_31110 [Chloroflexi bacterium]|nr:hypothetical protein [Chloroflexota bacterium]